MLYVGTQNGAGRRVNLDTGATELFTATPTCGSWGLGVTPDERFLYLACSGEGRVDIMDIASRQVVRQYSGYSEPRRVALSDDGTIVVVATASALCDLSLGASSAAAFGTRPTDPLPARAHVPRAAGRRRGKRCDSILGAQRSATPHFAQRGGVPAVPGSVHSLVRWYSDQDGFLSCRRQSIASRKSDRTWTPGILR
jgi:DNA-binding beta-propeller fold protein YncE